MYTRARTAALRHLFSHDRYEVLPTSRIEAWRRDQLARLGAGVAEVGRSAL
jgi:hypothetical protein